MGNPILARSLVAVALIMAGVTCHGQDVKPEDVSSKVLPSVMALSIEMNGGKTAAGTAFLAVKDGLAVTAWHMVRDAKRVTARFSNGEEFESSGIVDKDEKRNVALIKIKVFGRPLLPLDAAEPATGSTAFFACVREGAFGVIEGSVGQAQVMDGAKLYQLAGDIPVANSGSPAVNAKGEALGMIVTQTRDGQSINLVVPAAYVLGLDSTLPTQPWGQGALRDSGSAPSETQTDEVVDKQLVEAMAMVHDFHVAYAYADSATRGTGFRRGVPQLLYDMQQRLDTTVSALSVLRTADPLRQSIIKEMMQMMASQKSASEYFIKAVVIAQDAQWGAQSKDLWSRSQTIMNTIPGGHKELLSNIEKLAASSRILKQTLPAEGHYAFRLASRPSGFLLGAFVFTRNPFVLIVVQSGGVASGMGLRAGDKIISAGDREFKPSESVEDFKLWAKSHLGEKVKAVVERNGKREEITLKIPKEIPKGAIISQ